MLLIKKIISKAVGHGEISKMISNFSWLTADRIVRLGLNLFIVGWMARYLGREQYGLFNYATSFVVLVSALAGFGTNNIIIREILKRPEDREVILGSSFLIRQFGGILTVVICFVGARLINADDSYLQLLVLIFSLSFLMSSFDVIDLYFQSQLQSKYGVLANNFAFLVLSTVRIALIVFQAPLTAFAIAASAEVVVAQIGMIIMFRRSGLSIFTWKWNFSIAKGILRDSLPLMFAMMSSALYLRIGQVMLGNMASYTDVGEFSAATKISEVWYFVPLMVSSTIYPKIIEYKKISPEVYYSRLQEFFSLMSLIAYSAVMLIFFFNDIIIAIIFGNQFVDAGAILSVHIWAGLFVAMGIARNTWCNVENYTKGVFYSTLAGAVTNVLLNILFIPWHGGLGAAYATMIARIVGGYLATIFISRKVFIMQTKSLYLSGLLRMLKNDFLR